MLPSSLNASSTPDAYYVQHATSSPHLADSHSGSGTGGTNGGHNGSFRGSSSSASHMHFATFPHQTSDDERSHMQTAYHQQQALWPTSSAGSPYHFSPMNGGNKDGMDNDGLSYQPFQAPNNGAPTSSWTSHMDPHRYEGAALRSHHNSHPHTSSPPYSHHIGSSNDNSSRSNNHSHGGQPYPFYPSAQDGTDIGQYGEGASTSYDTGYSATPSQIEASHRHPMNLDLDKQADDSGSGGTTRPRPRKKRKADTASSLTNGDEAEQHYQPQQQQPARDQEALATAALTPSQYNPSQSTTTQTTPAGDVFSPSAQSQHDWISTGGAGDEGYDPFAGSLRNGGLSAAAVGVSPSHSSIGSGSQTAFSSLQAGASASGPGSSVYPPYSDRPSHYPTADSSFGNGDADDAQTSHQRFQRILDDSEGFFRGGGSSSPHQHQQQQQQQQHSSLWLNDDQQQQQQHHLVNTLETADPAAFDATSLAQAASGSNSASAFTPDDGEAEDVGQASGADQGEDEPLYVNPKQYGRIIKRREARARMDEKRRRAEEAVRSGKISASTAAALAGREVGMVARGLLGHTERGMSLGMDGDSDARARGMSAGTGGEDSKSYQHESRHKHAMRRPRGPGGRFLTAEEMRAREEAERQQAEASQLANASSSDAALPAPEPSGPERQQQETRDNEQSLPEATSSPMLEDASKVDTSDPQSSFLQDDEAQADDFLILE